MTRKNYEESQKIKYPDSPWMWKKKWENGKIQSYDINTLIISWVFTILWNGISSPLLFKLSEEIEKNKAALFGLIFPLIGFLMLVWSIRATIRWKKFGRSVVELTKFPATTGGTLEGELIIPSEVNASSGFKVTLTCKRHIRSSGSNNNSSTSMLWQKDIIVNGEVIRARKRYTTVPIYFDIPYECLGTEQVSNRENIYWDLTIDASTKGVDYNATFEVPVFKTEESNPDHVPNLAKSDAIKSVRKSHSSILDENNIIEDNKSGSYSLIFPAFRQKKTFLSLLIFTSIWTGIIVGMYIFATTESNNFGSTFIYMFIGIFALCDLMMLYFLYHVMSFKSSIIFNNDNLEIKSGALLSSKTHIVRYEDIDKLDFIKGMSSGNNILFKLVLKLKDGGRFTAAEMIKGTEIREVLRKIINDRIK